ncbi:unnamed protein product [Ceutorhynchus assimilis]|uniref:Uncharacterized protein n=1 Tax=Ceutorhynchus assimilis TaxID=467358 RepID=A0A9N9MDV9_9CUCU|nr:unnamed protein product [Ceutorhynchus assimilis]
MKIAKQKQFSAKIIKNKLCVNNEEYTAENLRTIDKIMFLEPIVDKHTIFLNTSAPPTPTITHRDSESSEEEIFDLEVENQEVQTEKVEEIKKKDPKKEEKKQNEKVKKIIAKTVKNHLPITQTPKVRTTRSGSTK